MTIKEIYLNGCFLPPEQGQVSVLDRGFLFGDGVYEVIPSYGGYFLGLEPHLERLEQSLDAIRLANPLTRDEWRAILQRLIGQPPAPDQSIYLQITRGAPTSRDHLCPDGIRPTVFAMASPIKARAPEIAERGLACITRPDIRWQYCQIKSIALLASTMMRREAAEAGVDETIMARDGMVTEASAANVFMVRAGSIVTPPRSQALLAGITRQLVLQLAERDGVQCQQRPLALDELRQADEIWISSSTRELLPVTRLDGAVIGDGRPGPLWRQIDQRYQAYKAQVRIGHV